MGEQLPRRGPVSGHPHDVMGWMLARPGRRAVIAALRHSPDGLTLRQLQARTRLPAATVNDILTVLNALELVGSVPPRGTAAGPKPMLYTAIPAAFAQLWAALDTWWHGHTVIRLPDGSDLQLDHRATTHAIADH